MAPRRFLLAFDHRASLLRGFFGVEGLPSAADHDQARLAKTLVWQGLERALEAGEVETASAGVLVDDTYGHAVIDAARMRGIATAVPLEESGRDELAFESAAWRERLAELDPTWAKVLVRYHPEGDANANERQRAKLAEVTDHCRTTDRGFMLELLVPAESQREMDSSRYEHDVRPGLVTRAIDELHAAAIEPDLWKLEGLEDRTACEAVAAAARANGRDRVGCLVLGRGADRGSVDRWLRAAAGVEGFVGFAIGRSIWWEAVRGFFDAGESEVAREAAADAIAAEYTRFVHVFESAAR